MGLKVIMTESTEKQPLVEEQVSVELPDEEGKLTVRPVEAGPMLDFLYRTMFR